MNKILIICASGIGNTIFFTPTLESLKKGLPKAKITLFVTKSALAQPVMGSGFVDKIIILNNHRGIFSKIGLLFRLRQENFDYSITAFPSNRWQFNLFAFLIGAKKRVTHRYLVNRWKTLSFLQNYKIPADRTLHDVDQNLNLLQPFKIKIPKGQKQWFYLSGGDKQKAEYFWNKNQLNNQFIVGVHPGSGGVLQEAKRWPLKKFIELGNLLIKQKKAKILIFGGPKEQPIKNELHQSLPDNYSFVIEAPLKEVAALIQKCQLFISNDSGLMNVAVGVGTRVIAIFGPTNQARTVPRGKNNLTISSTPPCSPCLKYPFDSSASNIECPNQLICFKKITATDVFKKIR